MSKSSLRPGPPTTSGKAARPRRYQDARIALWKRICAGQIGGHDFRPDVEIAGHRVDFACETAHLAIDIHAGSEVDLGQYDESRVAEIEAAGYLVLHVWRNDVLHEPEKLIPLIARALIWRNTRP
ncbi:DUF559 domain-containing protein [Maricaulis sp.]|uniref:endonuclease domain-containing protein n=1 Tax=Maricaulis sp. TaxID=1486257 RepID=UPI002606109D|nr:DUF559 domain-containing protein [Maricaulis sp.]